MKIINRKRSYKLILLLTALIIALFAVQMFFAFNAKYRILVIQEKKDSWQTIAMEAQVERTEAIEQLEACREAKQTLTLLVNKDL